MAYRKKSYKRGKKGFRKSRKRYIKDVWPSRGGIRL